MPQAMRIVDALAQEIGQALETADRGERLRDGLRVVIAGAPNAGKSTLLNRLVRREAGQYGDSLGRLYAHRAHVSVAFAL